MVMNLNGLHQARAGSEIGTDNRGVAGTGSAGIDIARASRDQGLHIGRTAPRIGL